MKKLFFIICILLIAISFVIAQQSEFPKLTGPYFGQKAPVEEPVEFAPGIVSNGSNASSAAVSPDGKEIYWDVDKIWFTRLENRKWTKPEMMSFCKEDKSLYRVPCLSPDGKNLFFLSTRAGSALKDKENIWYSERTSSGWSEPKPINSKVNALRIHWNITISNLGTLFFQGTRLDGKETGGIYYSTLEKGDYADPVKLGHEINKPGAITTCPFVAPDESYLIFNSMENSPENSGIFISFRDKSGNWLPAVLLVGGSQKEGGLSPRVTPDGKYLFYVNSGMFWMPISKRIKELRPNK